MSYGAAASTLARFRSEVFRPSRGSFGSDASIAGRVSQKNGARDLNNSTSRCPNQMGNLDGRVRDLRWSLQQLRHRPGRHQVIPVDIYVPDARPGPKP